jgi:hypothetical protein
MCEEIDRGNGYVDTIWCEEHRKCVGLQGELLEVHDKLAHAEREITALKGERTACLGYHYVWRNQVRDLEETLHVAADRENTLRLENEGLRLELHLRRDHQIPAEFQKRPGVTWHQAHHLQHRLEKWGK